MPDFDADYRALRHEAGAVWLPRDFVRVSGPDSLTFLQGQLSQDIDIPERGSTWALLLQPQGKMVALVRVARESATSFVLDTDAGWGGAVVERLNRFKLRVNCEMEAVDWRCLAIRGPFAPDAPAPAPGGDATGTAEAAIDGATDATGDLAVVAAWPGLPGTDLIGPAPEAPHGVRVCSLDAYEAVRIEAGIPVMGSEIDENTIPAEAGVVDMSVSFTKGCYTGQELVARIDSRGGNVPRRLRGVVMGTNTVPPPGAVVRVGDKDVGRITSVAESLDRRAPIALAYVGRAVDPPAEVVITWDGDGRAPARVEVLPLVGGQPGDPGSGGP